MTKVYVNSTALRQYVLYNLICLTFLKSKSQIIYCRYFRHTFKEGYKLSRHNPSRKLGDDEQIAWL